MCTHKNGQTKSYINVSVSYLPQVWFSWHVKHENIVKDKKKTTTPKQHMGYWWLTVKPQGRWEWQNYLFLALNRMGSIPQSSTQVIKTGALATLCRDRNSLQKKKKNAEYLYSEVHWIYSGDSCQQMMGSQDIMWHSLFLRILDLTRATMGEQNKQKSASRREAKLSRMSDLRSAMTDFHACQSQHWPSRPQSPSCYTKLLEHFIL